MEEELKKEKVTSSNAKCKNCGGNVVFDPITKKLKCPNCDSRFDFEKKQGQIKHYIEDVENDKENKKWAKKIKLVKCQTCGAEIMFDGLNVTAICPYCGSDYVVESENLDGLKPDVVVPFELDEDLAGKKFVESVKKNFFVPSKLKKKLPLDKIRGIYIPAFTFDNDSVTSYSGTLEKVHHHTDSKGRSYTTTETFGISGNYSINFRDFVIESSSKMTDREINSLLPYNLSLSYQYSDDYIRGYSVEYYEDAMTNCYGLAQKKMKDTIKSKILSQYDYDNVVTFSMHTHFSNEMYSYRLLPVYCMEFNYKNKKYMVQMNGQTGKIGRGLPVSPAKVVAVVFIGLLVILGLVLLFMYTSAN